MAKGRKVGNLLKSINNEQIIVCLLLVILAVLVCYYVNKNSTEQFAEHDKPKLYFFYVDWCGFCSKAKPEIAKLKSHLKNNKVKGKNVDLVEVNCDKEKDLANKFGIRAYPTLYLVNGEEKEQYNNGVSKEGLLSFLKEEL